MAADRPGDGGDRRVRDDGRPAEDIHRVFGVVLNSRFAAVVPTVTWIDALRRGKALERSNIFLSHEAAALAAV